MKKIFPSLWKTVARTLACLTLNILAFAPLSGKAQTTADLVLTWPELKRPALFAKDQRIAFIGDSITRPGEYILFLYDYYVTRFPDQPIRLYNFGIGGDTLKDALIRYENDIRSVQCDSAVILLGMNDAFRSGYIPGSENNSAILARRKSTRDIYNQRLTELISRLKKDNITPILCTPTCYDETTISKYALTPNANQSLVDLAQVIKEQAISGAHSVIELNAPLLAANAALQASDSSISLISGDRIHPLSSGQAVMVWAFLRQQNAIAEVADVEIALPKQRVVLSRGCEVKDLVVKPAEITYNYRPFALPLPRDKAWETAASCTTITRDLNQERLAITGATDGQWALRIGDVEAGTFTAQQLARGINLAMLPNTPQLQAAGKIHELNIKRNKIELAIRGIHYIEKAMKIPGGAPEALWRERIAAYKASEEYQKKSPNDFLRKEADQYESKKTRERELYGELEKATQEMYNAFPYATWHVHVTKLSDESSN